MKKLRLYRYKRVPERFMPMIYFLGIAVEAIMILIGNRKLGLEANTLILGLFFMIVAFVFYKSYGDMKIARDIRKALLETSERLREMEKAGCKDIYEQLKGKKEFFNNPILDEAYATYCKQIDVIAEISGDTKVDIEEYINYDLISNSVNTHSLNQVAGTMTGLGILGTFIGLSLGLNSFDLSGSATDIEKNIQPLMDGIKVAFHTSVCGMVYSLLFGYFYKAFYADVEDAVDAFLECYSECVVKRYDNGYTSTLYKYMEKQIELQQAILDKQEAYVLTQKVISDDLRDVKTELTQRLVNSITEILVPHIERMSSSVEKFAEQTQKNQIDGLERIVDQFVNTMTSSLGDSFQQLANIINETNEWQTKSLEQMQLTLDKINELAIDLATVNNEIQQSIASVKDYNEKIDKTQDIVNANLMSLNIQMDMNNREVETRADIIQKIVEQSDQLNKMVGAAVQEFKGQIERLEHMESNSQEHMQNEMLKLSEVAQRAITAINDANQTQAEMTKNALGEYIAELSNIKEETLGTIGEVGDKASKKIDSLLEVKENVSCDISEAADKLGCVVSELSVNMEDRTKETFAQFDKELSDIVQHFSATISHMDKSISKTPMVVDGVTQNIEEQFKTMQEKLDQYLEYTDKLHHDLSIKWEQLQELK